jgi:hypothetical protein
VVHHARLEGKKPKNERYILQTTTDADSDMYTVITAHPVLLERIHHTKAICCDFSYKRTVGSFNEWKVTGFDDRFQRRRSSTAETRIYLNTSLAGITYLTAYSNHEDKSAFDSLWNSLFKVTEKNMGRPLRIREFCPDDPTSRLLAIILDGDLAQALALGDYLVQYISKYASDELRQTLPSDPMELAKLILKFCLIHSQR